MNEPPVKTGGFLLSAGVVTPKCNFFVRARNDINRIFAAIPMP